MIKPKNDPDGRNILIFILVFASLASVMLIAAQAAGVL